MSVADYFKEVKKQRSETTKSAVSINYETLALQQAREQAAVEARRIREEDELLNARQRVQEAHDSDSEEERVVDKKAKKAKKDKKRARSSSNSSSSSSSSSSHDLSEPKESKKEKKAKKERSPSAERKKDKKKEKKKDKKHKKHQERS